MFSELVSASNATRVSYTDLAERTFCLVDPFRESKAYAIQLKQQLTEQVQICTNLQNNLNTSHNLINTLHNEILSLKSKNSDIYHQLRMERQCHKHATSKHGSMASQILLLKKADAISSARLSKGLRDSADTIANFLKINGDLRTELSQSGTTWSSQMEASTEAAKSKLISSDTRLKKKSPNSKKDSIGLHKSRNVPLKQQRPRSFDKNQFTIFHTKAFSRRKLAILFNFFPNLAVQQTASMTSFLLYSTQ